MTYRLYGALGSPYSIKMRALLRYRRIPHVWVQGRQGMELAQARLKTPVIPVLQYPDGSLANDSTPLIHDLEARHHDRSVIPQDPGDAFLAALIEDMADEWMTKWMFHYRWFRTRDQEMMSRWLAYDSLPGAGVDTVGAFAAAFRNRQVGRMAIVGCTPANQPLIEGTAEDFLAALDSQSPGRPFLFGGCPSLAEFAIHGQLSQLAIDPTPSDMMRERFPFAMRWVENVHDLSGLEGAWDAPHAPASPLLTALLALAGEVYLPFLAANARAVAQGADMVRFEARGCAYEQGVFKYQVKCLAALRAAFTATPASARARITPLLEEAGALAPLVAS
jgi:glutathione S-transferase